MLDEEYGRVYALQDLAKSLPTGDGSWMHNAADRMRVYEYIVKASEREHNKHYCIDEEVLKDVVCTAMSTDPSLVMQELPVAMTFLADDYGSKDIAARVHAVWAKAGIPAQCPPSVAGLSSIFHSRCYGDPLDPSGETALRNLVHPHLHLLAHSNDALYNLCNGVFENNWELDGSPTVAAVECARALYNINPALFHKMYADVVGDNTDAEVCEIFWKACGFPGTCFGGTT
jgi:hypothetical protein